MSSDIAAKSERSAFAPLGVPSEGYLSNFLWAQASAVRRYDACCRNLYSQTRTEVLRSPHLYFGWAAEMVQESALLTCVQQYLGEQIAVESAFLITKPPGSRFCVPPHQDGINERLELAADNSLSAWLAVTTANLDNGTLIVHPYSHTDGYRSFHVASKEYEPRDGGRPLTLSAEFNRADGVAINLAPGHGCLFSVALIHESHENFSNDFRIALNVRYVSEKGIRRRNSDCVPLLPITDGNWSGRIAGFPTWSDDEGLSQCERGHIP